MREEKENPLISGDFYFWLEVIGMIRINADAEDATLANINCSTISFPQHKHTIVCTHLIRMK